MMNDTNNNPYKNKEKLISFFHKNKRMPSYSEIAELCGYKSKNAAVKLVNKMIDEGFVDKDSTGKLIPSSFFTDIRVLGVVKAGFPSFTDDELHDTMSINEYLIDKKEATYILEVEGDSMIDAHILEGDRVLVERTRHANDGQIIIAEIDGEFTMKYFRKSGNDVWLEPANKRYKPIYPTEDLKVVAVLKGVIRKY
jgi:SOS regulatory protein LexA